MEPNPLLVGAVAGMTATVPMTAVMLSLHRALPRHQRYALPPRIIVRRAARKARVAHHIDDEPQQSLATYTAHFGYGTMMGAVYAPLSRFAVPLPAPIKGISFGLLVWAFGYLGWLPAAGLHPRATQEPSQRQTINIFSHVLWGACLGWMTHQLTHNFIARGTSPRMQSTKPKGARHDTSPAFTTASTLTQ